MANKKAKTTERDNKKAEIKEQQARLMNELNRIERAESRERAQPLVGKCFKFRNSYGHGSKGWWLYAKLISHQDHDFRVWQFETDEHGRFNAYFNETRYVNTFNNADEWVPITERQFRAAWRQQTTTLTRKAAEL